MEEHEAKYRAFMPKPVGRSRRNAIDCASIILPMTPPEEFAAPIRIGERPSCSDVIFCRLPNNMFEAASEPV